MTAAVQALSVTGHSKGMQSRLHSVVRNCYAPSPVLVTGRHVTNCTITVAFRHTVDPFIKRMTTAIILRLVRNDRQKNKTKRDPNTQTVKGNADLIWLYKTYANFRGKSPFLSDKATVKPWKMKMFLFCFRCDVFTASMPRVFEENQNKT